jgi:hypothetical protein
MITLTKQEIALFGAKERRPAASKYTIESFVGMDIGALVRFSYSPDHLSRSMGVSLEKLIKRVPINQLQVMAKDPVALGFRK